MQRQLIGMRVEVTETGEENLSLDTESGTDLDDLGDLFQLRGEAVVRGEDGLQRGDGLHGVGEGLGIGVRIAGDSVVGLHEGNAGVEREQRLCRGLTRAAFRTFRTTRGANIAR